jgi:hypothetical protein
MEIAFYRFDDNIPAGGAATFSVWVKSFDLSQANQLQFAGQMHDLTTEWQRIVVTAYDGESPNSYISAYLDGGSTPAGTQIALAFGQTEEHPFATEYIPTTSSIASRATEAADATGNGWSFALADNPALATIFASAGRCEFTFIPGHDLTHISGNPGLISVGDGADLVFIDGSGIASSDGTTNATKAVSYESGTSYDISVRWGGGKMAVSVDGTEGTEQDFDGSFSPGTHLRLSWANPYPWQISGLAFYDAATGGDRVAYWPFNGSEYVEDGDDTTDAGVFRTFTHNHIPNPLRSPLR